MTALRSYNQLTLAAARLAPEEVGDSLIDIGSLTCTAGQFGLRVHVQKSLAIRAMRR